MSSYHVSNFGFLEHSIHHYSGQLLWRQDREPSITCPCHCSIGVEYRVVLYTANMFGYSTETCIKKGFIIKDKIFHFDE